MIWGYQVYHEIQIEWMLLFCNASLSSFLNNIFHSVRASVLFFMFLISKVSWKRGGGWGKKKITKKKSQAHKKTYTVINSKEYSECYIMVLVLTLVSYCIFYMFLIKYTAYSQSLHSGEDMGHPTSVLIKAKVPQSVRGCAKFYDVP